MGGGISKRASGEEYLAASKTDMTVNVSVTGDAHYLRISLLLVRTRMLALTCATQTAQGRRCACRSRMSLEPVLVGT